MHVMVVVVVDVVVVVVAVVVVVVVVLVVAVVVVVVVVMVVVVVVVVVVIVVDVMLVVVVVVVVVRHHGMLRHPLTSSRRSYSLHTLLTTAKSPGRTSFKMHRWVLCFHCTIRHVSPCKTHWWAHSLAEVTPLS